MKPKAIFFDMDGVLYNSMPAHEFSWTKTFLAESINFDPQDAYKNEGRTGRGTINLVFQKKFNRDATEDEINRIYSRKIELIKNFGEAKIFPKMQDLIRSIHSANVQCFVVTGSQQPSTLQRLEKDFGFDSYHIINGNNVKFGKPHPEPYLIAIERSGLQACECAVVENAPLGIRSAKAANLFCIAVNTGKLDDEFLLDEHCDILFKSTEELFLHWNDIDI